MTTYNDFLETTDILIELLFETNDSEKIKELSAKLRSLYARYPEFYKKMKEV